MNEETLSSSSLSPLSSTSLSIPPIQSPSSIPSDLTTQLPSITNISSIPSDSSSHLLHTSTPTIISSTSQLPTHSSKSTGFITTPDHSRSSYSYPRDCYVTAEAKINNIPGIVLLDTSSGITIISSSHWKLIGHADSIRPYHG